MLYASVALTAQQGDTLRLEFAVTDEAGNVADITGTTPTLTLQPHIRPTDSLEVTGVLTNAAGGIFQVVLSAAQTAERIGLHLYQVVLEDISENRQTVSRGTINFLRSWNA